MEYNCCNAFILHFEQFCGADAVVTDFIDSSLSETEIRSNFVDGSQVSVTCRISETLRDVTKAEASLRRVNFSAFVHTCMIEELSKKGR